MNEINNLSPMNQGPPIAAANTPPVLAVDPIYLIIFLKKRLPLILVAALVVSGFLYSITRFTPRLVYRASTILMKQSKNLALGTDIPYLYQDTDFNTLMETVRLRPNLEETVKRLNLKMTPDSLFSKVGVERGNRSNLVTITVDAEEPKTAADIANTLTKVFIESYNRNINDPADKMYNYYIAQRQIMQDEVTKAEADFLTLRNQLGIVSYQEEMGLKLKTLSEQEVLYETALMNEKELMTKIADLKNRTEPMPDKVVLTESYRTMAENMKKTLELRLEELRQTYTDEHPKVIQLKTQIEELDKATKQDKLGAADERVMGENFVKRNFEISIINFENDLLANRKHIEGLKDSLTQLKNNLGMMTDKQKEYADAQRRVDLKREVLRIIENRIQQARMARDANVGDLQIVEYATPPRNPESSGKRMIILGGFAGTIFLGLLIASAISIFDSSVKSPLDLKTIKQINYLGLLPDKNRVPEHDYYVKFQGILAKIDLLALNHPRMVLTFSGINEGEGKTTFIHEVTEFKNKVQKKVLVIEKITNFDQADTSSIINPYIFSGETESPPLPEPVILNAYFHKLYLQVDSQFYKRYVSMEKLNNFLSRYKEYDYILIELFGIEQNKQVCISFFSIADDNILMLKYKESSRAQLIRILEELNQQKEIHLSAIINQYDPDFI